MRVACPVVMSLNHSLTFIIVFTSGGHSLGASHVSLVTNKEGDLVNHVVLNTCYTLGKPTQEPLRTRTHSNAVTTASKMNEQKVLLSESNLPMQSFRPKQINNAAPQRVSPALMIENQNRGRVQKKETIIVAAQA